MSGLKLHKHKAHRSSSVLASFYRLGNGTESDDDKKIKGNLELNSVYLTDTSRVEYVSRTKQNKHRGSGVNTIADCLNTQVYEQQ